MGNDILAEIESAYSKIAGFFPGPFKTWVWAYFHPIEALEKEKATFGNTAKHIAILGLFNVFLVGLRIAMVLALGASLVYFGVIKSIPDEARTIMIPDFIAAFVFTIFWVFTSSLSIYAAARLIGGKGAYLKQTLGIALINGGMTVVVFPCLLLMAIPCINVASLFLILLAAIYQIYGVYHIIRKLHEFSSGRAIAAMILAVGFWIAMTILLVVGIFILGMSMSG